MHLERPRPAVFRVTLHPYELSTLVATARWAAEGADGELPQEARDQLRQVLSSYDTEARRLGSEESRSPGSP
jgi:hypothetical protein